MGARVLVVDDDDSIRRLVSAILRRQRYETDEARDGREAIGKLQTQTYAAVFLDLMMPVCGGDEVIAFLQEHAPDQKRVIVMTAAGSRHTSALNGSVVHQVLQKPFDVQAVIESAAQVTGDEREAAAEPV